MAPLIHRFYARIFLIWRARRRKAFLERIKPQQNETLLDVGGYPGFWTVASSPVNRIDTLNVDKVCFDASQFPDHNIRVLEGNGCALPFPEKSYDILFSNSVIEHVGSWQQQKQFATEVRRVGRRLWIQTPAFEFPIEPHYLCPFVHWLPIPLRRILVRWASPFALLAQPTASETDEMINSIRLLTYREMKELFPDCDIYVERMLGILPKSYVAIRWA
jgi:Methyltransferase domain